MQGVMMFGDCPTLLSGSVSYFQQPQTGVTMFTYLRGKMAGVLLNFHHTQLPEQRRKEE